MNRQDQMCGKGKYREGESDEDEWKREGGGGAG